MNNRELAVITDCAICDETCILPLNHHSGRFRSGGRAEEEFLWTHPLTHYSSQNFTGPEPPHPHPGSAYAPCACFGLQGTKLRNEILIPQVWICTKRAVLGASLLEKVSLHQGWPL